MSDTPFVARDTPTVRAILRVVVTVVASALALAGLYLVRQPLSYLALALFLAVCVAPLVAALSRRMRRGLAIGLTYLGIALVPAAIGLILVPPVVRQTVELVDKLPEYAQQAKDTAANNEPLKSVDENFDVTTKLDSQATKLAHSVGSAAEALVDIGSGLVHSIFGIVEVLVLSMFMVGSGRRWINAALRRRPPDQAAAIEGTLDHMAAAVAGYVRGALAQALVAGASAFVVLVVLGQPSPLPLALIVAILDLIPLVGATIGAVIVGVATLFTNAPVSTLVWALFAILYQQFENYVIQPRIQQRATKLDPFLVVVAALFGGALLGVVGALLAIPVAAALQVALREGMAYRAALREAGDGSVVTRSG